MSLITADAAQQQLQSVQQQLLQDKAWQNAGLSLLAGLGVGAAGRGAMGLVNLTRRNLKSDDDDQAPGAPALVSIAHPQKMGAVDESLWGGFKNYVGDVFNGTRATEPTGIGWAIPAATAGAVGGAVAGWKGVDWVLDQRRRAGIQKQVDKARNDYQTALLAQYGGKQASGESTIGEDLSKLYQMCVVNEKQANWLDSLVSPDTQGAAMGTYLTGASVGGLLSAVAAYQYAKKRRDSDLAQTAQKSQARQYASLHPAPILAELGPMDGKAASAEEYTVPDLDVPTYRRKLEDRRPQFYKVPAGFAAK